MISVRIYNIDRLMLKKWEVYASVGNLVSVST